MNEVGGSSGRALALALVALVVLTAASWALAHAPLGAAHTAVALLIAATKATVVVFVFMELAHASTAARIVGATTICFIALLCAGIVADAALR